MIKIDNPGDWESNASKLVGTLKWMAPEIIRYNDKGSIASDVYSFAIIS